MLSKVARTESQKQLPELETVCPYCKGAGGEEPMYEDGWDICWYCMGAGHVPTEAGEKLMAFLKHQAAAASNLR